MGLFGFSIGKGMDEYVAEAVEREHLDRAADHIVLFGLVQIPEFIVHFRLLPKPGRLFKIIRISKYHIIARRAGQSDDPRIL